MFGGRKKSLVALVDEMEKTCIDPTEQMVFISHGDSLEDAECVEKLVRERLNVRDVRINYVDPVIGAIRARNYCLFPWHKEIDFIVCG